MHLSSSVHARNQYPSLCHITPKALSTSIGLHTAAGTNRRSTRELDKMQHISENDAATPKMVDRATFQADVDALRTREKAHMREGDQIAAARRRLPMVAVDGRTPIIGAKGPTTLLDAFEGRRMLIAYYYMWFDEI